jgi:hypothetical protein
MFILGFLSKGVIIGPVNPAKGKKKARVNMLSPDLLLEEVDDLLHEAAVLLRLSVDSDPEAIFVCSNCGLQSAVQGGSLHVGHVLLEVMQTQNRQDLLLGDGGDGG